MPESVLKFWFEEIKPQQHWIKDDDFDRLIIERFSELHRKARECELFEWRKSSRGRLAEIIILDQFSRNMFRGTAQSFAYDALALTLSQEAILSGAEKDLSAEERTFLYMPYMHSESLLIHDLALVLYEKNGLKGNLEFEKKHQEIIKNFGRYPHRNVILGRESSKKEIAFLEQPGSSF